ncbi:unnamed protein product, partial [Rotaria sp. Silwood1]
MDADYDDQITTGNDNSGSENLDDSSFEEKTLTKQLAKEKLNAVFQLLKMEKKSEMSNRRLKQVRYRVDNVYRHLCRLCDILENKDLQVHDPNPHSLEIDEPNKLLNNVQELFKRSSDPEQIRLMTIAPMHWDRVMLCK